MVKLESSQGKAECQMYFRPLLGYWAFSVLRAAGSENSWQNQNPGGLWEAAPRTTAGERGGRVHAFLWSLSEAPNAKTAGSKQCSYAFSVSGLCTEVLRERLKRACALLQQRCVLWREKVLLAVCVAVYPFSDPFRVLFFKNTVRSEFVYFFFQGQPATVKFGFLEMFLGFQNGFIFWIFWNKAF